MDHSGSLTEPRGIKRVGLRWLSLQHQSFSLEHHRLLVCIFLWRHKKKREEEEDRKVVVERQRERSR